MELRRSRLAAPGAFIVTKRESFHGRELVTRTYQVQDDADEDTYEHEQGNFGEEGQVH
jgi:hypothetical protein